MKNYLSIIFAATLFMACNSGKEKTSTSLTNTTTDTTTNHDIISPDSNNQAMIHADSVVPVNRLIIPGKSIGLTSIDEKNADASKHLGPPASEDAAMGGKELVTWYSKPVIHGTDTVINETDIFFTTNMGGPDEASRVRHIRITSSFFMTAQRVGTGTSLDSIQKNFQGIKKIATYTSPKTKKQVSIYDENHSGIAFEIDVTGKCIGITVHKPDEEAYETYNSIFGDVNYL